VLAGNASRASLLQTWFEPPFRFHAPCMRCTETQYKGVEWVEITIIATADWDPENWGDEQDAMRCPVAGARGCPSPTEGASRRMAALEIISLFPCQTGLLVRLS
jgi:hypothetical protein